MHNHSIIFLFLVFRDIIAANKAVYQNGRPWLMVDRQKIETNIAHNFFCSLALTDFNNYLIFTVVDEKNWTVLLLQQCLKISYAVYRLHNATAYQIGVMNGPLKFLTARKILPLLDLLAKFKRVLACACSPNFVRCSQARKTNFFISARARKKIAVLGMLAKTIRHPFKCHCVTDTGVKMEVWQLYSQL